MSRDVLAPQQRASGGYVAVVIALAGAVNLVLGGWAFLAPESFFRNIAVFEPFNLHLTHDAGAFQLATGAAVLALLYSRDAVFVVLFGATAGAVVHWVSHVLDRDLGGRASDPWLLGLLALLMLGALLIRIRTLRDAPRVAS